MTIHIEFNLTFGGDAPDILATKNNILSNLRTTMSFDVDTNVLISLTDYFESVDKQYNLILSIINDSKVDTCTIIVIRGTAYANL